jgi:Raf kinase inhibitor-like YbhB/YbcL family protein
MSLELHSTAFHGGETIPREFAGDGPNKSPPLEWSGAPGATKAYALIVDDPDAPKGTFIHWVIYDIPATQSRLPEDVAHAGAFTDGRMQGDNDFGHRGWDGPLPPRGDRPHRYFFKLYALDAPLGLDTGASKGEVERAMEGHVLARAELVGRYARS